MKKINGFKASWNEISGIIHDMKNAVTVLAGTIYLTNTAKKRIIDGLNKIDECINKIARNNK